MFSESGILTIVAFISPFINERAKCKEIIGADNFIEVYIKSDVSTCEARDDKGLYKKARLGEIKNFTGIDSPYEPPTNSPIVINTKISLVPEQGVDFIIQHLELLNYI